jgi:hypothetical protein
MFESNKKEVKENIKFANKPDYQKNMSKRSKTRIKPVIFIKEEMMDIPDNDHVELFLNRNIFT